MKRVTLFVAVAVILFASDARAQYHGEVGAFIDYFRLQQTKSSEE